MQHHLLIVRDESVFLDNSVKRLFVAQMMYLNTHYCIWECVCVDMYIHISVKYTNYGQHENNEFIMRFCTCVCILGACAQPQFRCSFSKDEDEFYKKKPLNKQK